MTDLISWEHVTIGVFVVVGLIEYVKGFARSAPAWVWRVTLVPASFAVAASIEHLPPFVLVGLVILAAAQLGYEVVVETVRKRMGGAK